VLRLIVIAVLLFVVWYVVGDAMAQGIAAVRAFFWWMFP
jgi:hypothetical protein